MPSAILPGPITWVPEFTPFEVIVLMYLVLWGEDYRNGRVPGKDRRKALEGLVGRGLIVAREGRRLGESEYVLTPAGVAVSRAICMAADGV